MKNSGKSTLAEYLNKKTSRRLIKIDELIEQIYSLFYQEKLTFREIHQKHGAEYFRNLEANVVNLLTDLKLENCVIDCGGGTVLNPENQFKLKQIGKLIWLKPDLETNFRWIMKNGVPSFFKYPEEPRRSFDELVSERFPIYESLADVVLEYRSESIEEIAKKLWSLV